MINHTYYLSANSCSGYVSFLDEYINDFKKIIVLKNISNKTKTKIFETIKRKLDGAEIIYDLVMRCGYVNECDAIILVDKSMIITDEYLLTSSIPFHADIVNFYDEHDFDFVFHKRLTYIKNQISETEEKMFYHLSEAKKIHDDWEKIYISNMDFNKMNGAADELIKNIFNNFTKKEYKKYSNINRFFGTLLSRNSINYIDELTKELKKRIFIKGRPGSGKSPLLKKIVSNAHDRGLSTETYYCSFDPKSLDMVVIRDIGVCIFDSTSPHEKNPIKDTDIIFDVYDIAINENTDEINSEKLMHITSMYNSEIKKAKECMYTQSLLREKFNKLIDTNLYHIEKSIDLVLGLSSIK